MEFALQEIDVRTGADKGAFCTIVKLDGTPMLDAKGVKVEIELNGSDSDAYKKAGRENLETTLDRKARAERNNTTISTVEALANSEADGCKILAAVTRSWKGINTPAGEPIPCTPENAEALYKAYPIIKEQVDAFVHKRANFLPTPRKS